MAGAVEAVAPDLVLLIPGVGQGVHVGLGGHGLVEGGVEHGHHGGAGHELPAGLDSDDVGGVVQRRQGIALLNGGHNLVRDQDGGGKLLPAVDHPVAHRADLAHGGDDAVVLVRHRVQHGLDGLGMGGHGDVDGVQGLFPLGLVGEFAVNADALAQALGQQNAARRVQKLILQGGTPRVDDQNVHDDRLLFLGEILAEFSDFV